MLGFLREGIQIPRKRILSLVILFAFNLAAMYFYHLFLMEEILNVYFNSWDTVFFGRSLFYISLSISQIIGAILAGRFSRKTILQYWIILGVVSLVFSTFLQNQSNIFLLCLLLGFSFGLGIPSCFAALADFTLVEERGRVSGIVQFSTFFLLILLILVPSMLDFGVKEYQYLSIILRLLSFSAILLDPFDQKKEKSQSFMRILGNRQLILYSIPWVMFNLSNGVLVIIENQLKQNVSYDIVFTISPFLLYAAALIFGLTSGVIADRNGRKLPHILGVIALGIAYALVGITSTPQSWFATIAISGVGWGFLMVAYQWTVLGDISPVGSREKFYAVGFIVPTIVETVFQFISSRVSGEVNISWITAALSVFLFISIFPLLMAKETLPENKMQDRRLRDYLKKVTEAIEESKDS
jgi:MFS family permease